MKVYEGMWGNLCLNNITRRVVIDFVNGLTGSASTRTHAVAVLSRKPRKA